MPIHCHLSIVSHHQKSTRASAELSSCRGGEVRSRTMLESFFFRIPAPLRCEEKCEISSSRFICRSRKTAGAGEITKRMRISKEKRIARADRISAHGGPENGRENLGAVEATAPRPPIQELSTA